MKQLLVRGPHSHRARQRFAREFEASGIAYDGVVISLGMNGRGYVIPDTVEALTLARRMGATLAKKQWNHLREESN